MHAKVVLATGVEQLDREIARALAANKVAVAGECYYLEGILPYCERKKAGVVVVSPELPGSVSLEETVLALRHSPMDIRCVLLPGPEDLEESFALARRVLATGAGVYDFVFSSMSSKGSTVSVEQVVERVLCPASFADAEAALSGAMNGVPFSKDDVGEKQSAETSLPAAGDRFEKSRRDPILLKIRRCLQHLFGRQRSDLAPDQLESENMPGQSSFPFQAAETVGAERAGTTVQTDDSPLSSGRERQIPLDGGDKLRRENGKEGKGASTPGLETELSVVVEKNSGILEVGTLSNAAESVILLLGPQSSALTNELAALGWTVTHDAAAQADAAVVDADLLSGLKLSCPAIGLSDKISRWFQPDSDGALVVADRLAIPSLIASHACQGGGIVKPIPDQTHVSKKGNGVVYAFYSGAQGSQGKTVLAINAGALLVKMKRGSKVCVVDLDTDKAGLTLLLGYSEARPPGADVADCVQKLTANAVQGPAGSNVIPAPIFTKKAGWFPTTGQVRWLISALTNEYDYVLLDFGARLASPPVLEALRMSDRIFVVSTPMRTALSAIARFRGRELMEMETGSSKITAVINRVGMRGSLAPRDAATLLGFADHCEIPEDPAVAVAENDALDHKPYRPPVCSKKNLIGPALSSVLEAAKRRAKSV